MDIKKFTSLRPYLYHLTHSQNVSFIQSDGILHSTSELISRSDDRGLLRRRCLDHHTIKVSQREIVIRDQAPLHQGPIQLDDGWSYEDLVNHINQFVFLWPGNGDRLIPYGERHFARYAHEDPVIFRFCTADLLAVNGNIPLFSRCNSGAPRCSRGKYAPRGADTFLGADGFGHRPSSVVEVVLKLPEEYDLLKVSASKDGTIKISQHN